MAAPKNLSAGQIINQLRRAPVGRLDRVAYLVCQRSLRHLAWMIRLLRTDSDKLHKRPMIIYNKNKDSEL